MVSPGRPANDPQDVALAVGDADDLGAALQLAALHVEGERAEAYRLDARGAGCERALQDVGDAQQQLARLEGLGEVVVGADFQSADAVRHLGARGEHEDRNRRGLLQRLGEFEAAFARHHHVDDQQVEGDARELAARLGGGGGRR